MSVVYAASQQALSFSACAASNIVLPNISGLEFNPIQANVVHGASESLIQAFYIGHGATEIKDASYCNVSLSYSHTGHSDTVNVQVWLPSSDDWNGRLMAVGGGGFAAGLFSLSFSNMLAAVDNGYAAVSTDAGHDGENHDPEYWALKEPGEVDMVLLENFAYRAYGEQAKIGKAVSESFYGSPPKRSYWSGCSTGGRQGLVVAQRFPDAFDGILATAPAINWAHLLPSLYWPQQIMNELRSYPRDCELAAITAAAIAECDLHDGVKDGIIAAPEVCKFNPHALVGKEIDCGGTTVKISIAAAAVAEAAWSGPQTQDNSSLWHGFSADIALTGAFNPANTLCPAAEGPCTAATGFPPSNHWMKWFVAKDPGLDLAKLSRADYVKMFHQSIQEYQGIMSTDNPDLSGFKKAGGKMITIHGTADQLIPVRGSQEYYNRVLAVDPKAREYYKYFEAPGHAHCFGGPGAYPEHVFEDLVAWVEEGLAPETLLARTNPNLQGRLSERPLCQYPLVARYDGTGDIDAAANYHCAEEHLGTTPISTVIHRTKQILEEAVRTGTIHAEL